MGDGAFTANDSGTLSDNVLDFDLMDELLFDGFWLESTRESNFWEPDQASISEEAKTTDFVDHKALDRTQMDEFGTRHRENLDAALHSASSGQPEGFLVEGSDMNRRLWVGPTGDPTPNTSVRKRLVQAIEYLRKSTSDKDALIQLWVPVKRGGGRVLSTKNQPFSLDPNCRSLAEYRHISRNYQFAAEEDSKELVGLPGRVFLKKLPEWTPDVRFFMGEEYPRVNHAQQYNVRGCLALPVFQRGSGTCLGVVEIVSTAQKVNYRPELENVCKALEAVDLSSSIISTSPNMKDCDESYQLALVDIRSVLKYVCDMNKLPLAQTWASCSWQGKGGCRHSEENYVRCVSTVDSACYVRDPQVMDFHAACSEHHLLKAEGLPGGAFMTDQPCFATDITAFSKTDYPLSHHAKIFGMRAAVAIRVQSIYTKSADFVLEFFLPLDCTDAEDQKQMLNSIFSALQQICHCLHVIADQKVREETTIPDDEKPSSSVSKSVKEKTLGFVSPAKELSLSTSSWVAPALDNSGTAKDVAFSLDNHQEDPEEECKLTTQWDNNKAELHHTPTSPKLIQIQQRSGSKGNVVGSEDVSAVGVHNSMGDRSTGQRRRTKTEKSISLQDLRQYFSGSLKDAAKSIGVCPTTLKRICRQHGITRWPSRKIKKVGHSLRKLQLVIDSVQCADGAIRLSSFYTNFPELNSANLPTPSNLSMPQGSDHLQELTTQPEGCILSPETTASKSPSSSGSHSSSSSFCYSTGPMQSLPVHVPSAQDASSAEECRAALKKTCSDAELHDLVKREETKLLGRSQSQKIFIDDASPDTLPSLPQTSSQILQSGSLFRVKVNFGEEKVRFSLQPRWGFADLLKEVRRRFSIDDLIEIDLKYLDDDNEWVLLTCDADLEECIDIHKSSKSTVIRLSIHQGRHFNVGSTSGSHGS
ncbi:protein NLP2-like isoform X2 [Coffea arabica]|uniref:Protein NLP2-like isoform X2 n=1 Tax=Coffea arabica TaxID=13443 RepID=A0A6P6UE09_COFAR